MILFKTNLINLIGYIGLGWFNHVRGGFYLSKVKQSKIKTNDCRICGNDIFIRSCMS